jgi:multidrug efflux pump subunit AcrA (membrane-fusion protein)
MKRNQKLWIGGGVLAALVITVFALSSGGTDVETVRVSRGAIVRTVEDTGYVRAVTSRDLYATQSARVVALPVETGQAVKQGQTLAVLANPDLAVQVDQTRSQLAQAESALDAAGAARHLLGTEELAESHVVDEEHCQGPGEAPEEPEDAVLVACLELAARQEEEQLAVRRDVAYRAPRAAQEAGGGQRLAHR